MVVKLVTELRWTVGSVRVTNAVPFSRRCPKFDWETDLLEGSIRNRGVGGNGHTITNTRHNTGLLYCLFTPENEGDIVRVDCSHIGLWSSS